MFLLLSGWTLVREGRIGAHPSPVRSLQAVPSGIPTSPVRVRETLPAPATPAGPRPTGRPVPRSTAGVRTGPHRAEQAYRIEFGPTSDLRKVESFVELLNRSYGIVGRIVTRPVPLGYRVLSGPAVSQFAAEQRAAVLAGVGIPSRIVAADGRYRLVFGQFPAAEEAEAVARRVRRYGFTAVIEPQVRTVYLVIVRRVPQTTAVEIARHMRRSGFGLVLRAER